jgi:hypothetical protein
MAYDHRRNSNQINESWIRGGIGTRRSPWPCSRRQFFFTIPPPRWRTVCGRAVGGRCDCFFEPLEPRSELGKSNGAGMSIGRSEGASASAAAGRGRTGPIARRALLLAGHKSIEIFCRCRLWHCRPQQRGRYGGSHRQDQKTFPPAETFEHKAGCGGADRSGDGYHGTDEAAH